EHDGHQDGAAGHRTLKISRGDRALLVYRKVGYPSPVGFDPLERVQYCLVFNGRRDEAVPFGSIGIRNAQEGQVVGFRGATSEDDLFCRRADERRDLFPSCLNGLSGRYTEYVVAAGSITKVVFQEGK